MRGRDAGARCGGARNGPPGLQKRAVQESLRTAEKSRAGKPPDRKKGCAGKPPDRRRGRLTEAPAADRRGTHKDAQRQAAAARKKALSALPSDSVTRKSLTTERPERYVVPVFRVTFGLHSVVIQPRGQRPTSAMPRPSTPPAAPSTPLFSFHIRPPLSTPGRSAPPHCIRPVALHSARLRRKAVNKPQPRFFPLGPTALHPTLCIAFRPPASQSRKQTSTTVPPFGPAALHPTGRTARTGGPPPPLQGCRRPTPVAPLSPLNASASSPLAASLAPSRGIFAPSTRHLRSLDAASSLPRRGIFLPAAGEAPRFSVGGAVFRALIPTFAAQVRSVAAGSAGGGKSGQRRAPRKPIT